MSEGRKPEEKGRAGSRKEREKKASKHDITIHHTFLYHSVHHGRYTKHSTKSTRVAVYYNTQAHKSSVVRSSLMIRVYKVKGFGFHDGYLFSIITPPKCSTIVRPSRAKDNYFLHVFSSLRYISRTILSFHYHFILYDIIQYIKKEKS